MGPAFGMSSSTRLSPHGGAALTAWVWLWRRRPIPIGASTIEGDSSRPVIVLLSLLLIGMIFYLTHMFFLDYF